MRRVSRRRELERRYQRRKRAWPWFLVWAGPHLLVFFGTLALWLIWQFSPESSAGNLFGENYAQETAGRFVVSFFVSYVIVFGWIAVGLSFLGPWGWLMGLILLGFLQFFAFIIWIVRLARR